MNFKTFAYSVLDKRIERATGFETAWGRVVYNNSTLNVLKVPDLETAFTGCELYRSQSGVMCMRVRPFGLEDPFEYDVIGTETPIENWNWPLNEKRILRPGDGRGPYFIATAYEMSVKATERRRMWQDRIRTLAYARALVEGAGQRLEPVMTALDAIVKSYPTIEDIIVNYARDRSYAKN